MCGGCTGCGAGGAEGAEEGAGSIWRVRRVQGVWGLRIRMAIEVIVSAGNKPKNKLLNNVMKIKQLVGEG